MPAWERPRKTAVRENRANTGGQTGEIAAGQAAAEVHPDQDECAGLGSGPLSVPRLSAGPRPRRPPLPTGESL